MELTESLPVDNDNQHPSLTRLDSNTDTFESCLIQLLQAYTVSQRASPASPPSSNSTPQPPSISGEGSPVTLFDISPESLNALSSEQVSLLVTSNSVNYEVIQQIMAQKQGYHGVPNRMGGACGVGVASNGNGGIDDVGGSRQSSRQQTPDVGSPRPIGGEGGVSTDSSSSSFMSKDASDMNNLQRMLTKTSQLQITPEHLQQLQQQVSDLLRSRQVSLPADMTSQQQQMLIQSVLLKQLHLQQEQAREKQGRAGSNPPPPPPPTTQSGGPAATGGGSGEGSGMATASSSQPASSTVNSNVDSLPQAKGKSTSSSLESILSSKPPNQTEEEKMEEKEKVSAYM